MTSIFKTWHFWLLVLTFIVGGIGAITGIVSPSVAGTLTSIVTFINILIHAENVKNQAIASATIASPTK